MNNTKQINDPHHIGDTLVSFRTKANTLVFRQQYTGRDGQPCFSDRFYVAKMKAGKRVRFPLSPLPRDAAQEADRIVSHFYDRSATMAAAQKQFNPMALARENAGASTVADLLAFFAQNYVQMEIAKSSANEYRGSMIYALRGVEQIRTGKVPESIKGGLKKETYDRIVGPVVSQKLSVLTGKFMYDFRKYMLEDCDEDEEELQTAKITCDARHSQFAALVCERAQKFYRLNSDLVLPDFTEFLEVEKFGTQKMFRLPDEAVIKAVIDSAAVLKAKKNLNEYRAFLLCLQCGLRKSEATATRLDWFDSRGHLHLKIRAAKDGDPSFRPKHGHERTVAIQPHVMAELRTLATGNKFIVGENPEDVFDRLYVHLRACGVTANKPAHELRKFWMCAKAIGVSVFAASEQGGHRDTKTTMAFYAKSLFPESLIPFWIPGWKPSAGVVVPLAA